MINSNGSGCGCLISARPAWADRTTVDEASFTHAWTAPSTPEHRLPGGRIVAEPVEVFREDDLQVTDAGVTLRHGLPHVFVLGARFTLDQARALATALTEVCDRVGGVR